MDVAIDTPTRTFVQVAEIWVPEGDRLVHGGGNYGGLEGFEAASRRESFARGEGLPGRAWAEARPSSLAMASLERWPSQMSWRTWT